MKSEFNCPICSSNAWNTFQRFHYSRDEKPCLDTNKGEHRERKASWISRIGKGMERGLRIVGTHEPKREVLSVPGSSLTPYASKRRRVLFDLWFPGESEIVLEAIYCSRCGFVCYRPRPEEADMRAKYEYLHDLARSKHGKREKKSPSYAERMLDLKRANRILKLVKNWSDKSQLSVLDYGGGDGRVLLPFLEEGHDCFLVDFDKEQVPGVKKIADVLQGIPKDSVFDSIICSHVLEHLTDPLGLLQELRNLLSRNGLVYAEVPNEIWAGIPIKVEPITHCNFFSLQTFKTLFARAEFEILDFRKIISNYGKNFKENIWILAKKTEDEVIISDYESCLDSESLLFPTKSMNLKRELIQRFYLPFLKAFYQKLYCT